MNATTSFIRYTEPTVRNDAALAYSQCLPEADGAYSPQPQYDPYFNQYASMPQQPAPAAKSTSAGKGLLLVAGLSVVGAAAFAGVMLLNSSDSQPARTTAASPAAASDTAGSAVVNLPSAVDIPAPAPAENAQVPVIVNNPAPVRVSGPVSSPKTVAAPRGAAAPALKPAPAPAAAPAPGPAPTGPGVSIKAPGVEVGVPSQGGVSVKTPGVEVGVPGQNGGDVVVAVPGGQPPVGQTNTDETKKDDTKPAGGATPAEGTKPAGGEGTQAEGTKTAANAVTDVVDAAGAVAATAGK